MNRKFLYLIILVSIVVGSAFYAFYIPELLNNAIVGITAIVIVWYTIETARLADLTEKQIKINIRPVIIVLEVGEKFKIKNVGKSAALNIDIHDVVSENSRGKCLHKFARIPVLAEKDDIGVSVQPYINNEAIGSSADVVSANRQLCYWVGPPYQLEIDYMDIENGKWQTVTLVNKVGIHFQGIKKNV